MFHRIGLTAGIAIALLFIRTASADGPTRISFLPGTTSYTWTTTLTPGAPSSYLLRLFDHQTLFLTKSGNASIEVLAPDGNVLTEATAQPGPWGLDLAQTGDYTLLLDGAGTTTISAYVPPRGAAASPSVPLPASFTPIRFEPGATSYSLTTFLSQGLPQGYSLRMMAEQRLSVTTRGNATLALLDGALHDVPPASEQAGVWQFAAPQTGTFSLVLLGDGPVTLSFDIPPLSAPPPPPAERILFAPGATSTDLTLELDGTKSYRLGIASGQMLYLSATGDAKVAVLDPQSNPLSEAPTAYDVHAFYIPQTGDYTVTLTGNGPVQLKITIPPV